MSSDKIIKLVQGDTRPLLSFYLTNQVTGLPVDMTGATAKFYVKKKGAAALTDTLTGTMLVGRLLDDGKTVDATAPYNVAGAGGGVQFPLNPTTLATSGTYTGEIEVTFSDTGIATVYDTYTLKVRAQNG